MPPEVEEFYRLFALYATAGSAAARSAAWKNAILYLVRNPRVYAYVGGNVSPQIVVAVERILLRQFAAMGVRRGAQATAGSGARLFVARLGLNFAVSPKIPVPQAQLALTIAIALGTCGQAFAESNGRASKFPGYEQYLMQYMQRIIKVVEARPDLADRLSEPQTFDQWLLENP
jgi:hypothetical protein